MDANLVGMSAAITTSCLWTFSSLLFTSAGRKIGAFSVSAYRIIIAVAFLSISSLVLFGNPFPIATNGQWFWMGLSGIVGLGIGDFALFRAFVVAGPRLTLSIMTSSAIFATAGAYLMLGETIRPFGLVGVAITLAGIIVAVSGEAESRKEFIVGKSKLWGLLLALLGASCQGFGVVISKKGMFADPSTVLNPLSATLIRMLIAALFIWVVAVPSRKLSLLRQALSDKEGIKSTTLAAFLAPFLGVTFSMIAVANTQTGIAQTLMSLMPVLVIPVVWLLHRQKTCSRGILGAVTSVIGVAVIFLL